MKLFELHERCSKTIGRIKDEIRGKGKYDKYDRKVGKLQEKQMQMMKDHLANEKKINEEIAQILKEKDHQVRKDYPEYAEASDIMKEMMPAQEGDIITVESIIKTFDSLYEYAKKIEN